jgi:hypothetical protein
MAIPERPYGYHFEPAAKPTAAEVMACLQICLRLLNTNECLPGPPEEIEQLPANVKRHFEKTSM